MRISTHGVVRDFSVEGNYILHFIRHPVDQLVSGYLYHKACNEPGWTDTPNLNHENLYHFPDNMIFSHTTYCRTLQQLSIKAGLELELRRSLYSDDGIGKMIKDTSALYSWDSSRVFQLCLSENVDLAGKVEQFVRPWMNNTSVSLGPINVNEGHMTGKLEHKDLYETAFATILAVVPVEILVTFPCASEYFFDTAAPVQKFLSTALGHLP